MRRDDLAPRTEGVGSRRRNERAAGLPLLRACLLIDHEPPQFATHLRDGVRLRRGNRGEEARGGVERALGVIAGEAFLVRPLVAPVQQLADQRTLGVAQGLAEHVAPRRDHHAEQRGAVPLGQVSVCRQPTAVAEV